MYEPAAPISWTAPTRAVRLAFGLVVGICLAIAGAGMAWAQNVGTLQGHVYDQSGLPLKGVNVSITSPTQIGGTRTLVTNDEGGFKFPGLFPGKFKVTVAAPKLRTLVQQNVQVSQGQATDLDLVMEVETATEEIKIIERAPVINQASTRVGESFDEAFMNSLPLESRDYQGVAALTPGVRDNGSGNAQVRGGTSFSNRYTVDGFNTTDPVTRTFSQNFSFSAIANMEVTTAGSGAEGSSTTGGLQNIVTKSGSNRFELDTSVEYSDQNLEFFKDNLDAGKSRFMRLNTYVGGPVKRDVLWYAISGAFVDITANTIDDPNFARHPDAHVYGGDGLIKLTFRPSPRNQLDLLGTASSAAFNNILQDPTVEPEAERRQFQRSEFVGLTWQYIGPLFLISRLGYRQQGFDVGPQACQWDPAGCTQTPSQIDLLTGVLRGNYTSQQLDQRRTVLFSGHTEYMFEKLLGSHNLRLGWEIESMKQDLRVTRPGDVILENIGSSPYARTEYCSNDPLLDNGECRHNFLRSAIIGAQAMVNLQDSWKPTRYLTFKPGVAFHYGTSENDRQVEVTDITAFTPHLAVLWDPTHDGKTKLQLTVDGQADTGFLALARFTSRSLYSKRCLWDEEAKAYIQNCRSSGGSDSITVGLPCGPTGIGPDGNPCRTKLKTPRVWEATLGGEREVFTGIAVGAQFIYKRFMNQWEDAETNGNWNEGGTALNRAAPFKTDRSQFVYDLQTPADSRRTYQGVTVALRKREGRAKALLAYTWSKYEGPVDSSFASNFLDNPGQTQYYYGPLAADARHDVRALVTYQINSWLSMGTTYLFASGGPYNRFSLDPVYGSFSRFTAHRGYDSNGTLNPDDDQALRLPDQSLLNLQVRASLEPLTKQRIEAWVDALNLLALRTTTSVVNSDTQFWGRPTSRMGPLELRVGLRYRY
jgi:hypothetical protein